MDFMISVPHFFIKSNYAKSLDEINDSLKITKFIHPLNMFKNK